MNCIANENAVIDISLEELFNNSFVISINEKQLAVFVDVFSTAFPGYVLPKPFRGIKNSGLSGAYNCCLSHGAVVRTAKALDLPFVAIFEDDAYPCMEADGKLANLLHNIPCEANILMLGWIQSNPPMNDVRCNARCNPHIKLVNHGIVWGTHAWIIFKPFYDAFLNACEKDPGTVVDHMCRKYGSVLISDECLFIQFNPFVSTMGDHIGYTTTSETHLKYPPPEFKPYRGMEIMRLPWELEELSKVVRHTGLKDVCMLEVGSYAGESADRFASLPEVKELWCIDTWKAGWDPDDRSSFSDFTEVENAFDEVARRYPGKIHKFKGTLQEFVARHPEVRPDIVYVDADHRYESVKQDLLTAKNMYPVFISGHDFNNGWAPGVVKAVKEILGEPDAVFNDSSWIKKTPD